MDIVTLINMSAPSNDEVTIQSNSDDIEVKPPIFDTYDSQLILTTQKKSANLLGSSFVNHPSDRTTTLISPEFSQHKEHKQDPHKQSQQVGMRSNLKMRFSQTQSSEGRRRCRNEGHQSSIMVTPVVPKDIMIHQSNKSIPA